MIENFFKPVGMLYICACALLGTILFWGILLYRLSVEGPTWLWETSNGIVLAGLLGIAGVVTLIGIGINQQSEARKAQLDRIERLLQDRKLLGL